MELTHEFRVGLPVQQAWEVLLDVERIAPCMPGAQLQEIEGDEYRGVVKVKVGPITAQYKGKATFVERDDASHRAVLRAEGRDTRGQGNASANVTAWLSEDGDATKVVLLTELKVTGRVAQLGRGVLADVSGKLLGEFVSCLESTILSGEQASEASEASQTSEASEAPAQPEDGEETVAPPAPTYEPAQARRVDQPAPEPIDLLGAAGAPLLKRAAPVIASFLGAWLLRRAVRRLRARRRRRRERA